MSLNKTCSVALASALLALALVGVTSATAETTALCKKHENPCAAENIYMGHFAAMAENLTLLTSATDITCKKSQILGFALNLNNPLQIHIEVLNFTEDCLTSEGEGCVFEPVELGLLLLLRTGSNLGSIQMVNTKVLVICPGAFIHCVYGGKPLWHAVGSPNKETLASIHSNDVPWEHGEGLFCPEEAKLDALYKILLPDPIVISS